MKAQRIANPVGERLNKRLYTIQESAEYLGRSVWSVRELIWKGLIPYIKVGRRVHVDIYDLERFIETHKITFTY